MSPPPTGPPLPFAKGFAASAIAACGAETLTLPLDMAKVRLQLQKTGGPPGGGGPPPKYRGLLGTVATVAREEGVASLWKGLVPALHRQVVYGGLRIGLYEPVKGVIGGDGLAGKVAAGLATGALAIAVASPTDLVKVRMQADGAAGAAKKYPSALGAYGTIVRTEGVRALWTGLGPNVGRNAVINAAELASYDVCKDALVDAGAPADSIATHLAAGLGAGFFAVCCGSPVDVVKSRMMGNTARYSSVLDCFAQTWKEGGARAFYKGFTSNFARLGAWNSAMFVLLEQARAALR